MRGTSPSFTQTMIDGHNIGSGDWFVLNQSGTVGRSVSYSLLPSELVDKVVVHKSSEAKLVEGGATGTVDIITRNPLNFERASASSAPPARSTPTAGQVGSADLGTGQLEERRRHLRRDAAGVQRRAPPAPRRPGTAGLRAIGAGRRGQAIRAWRACSSRR
jgi:hypothetical protein